ncbi:hypothetical protein ASF69_00350 [Rhizobium sp. Leaf311]|uniref:hypothetical protein n=1 Tax=Rhizobium sp. Leaf311 TaxID=1736332 RepID=UPI0007125271|nr:hypothetical protein [Rhizobium sp. Leaf311]KQQ60931.1 hypothetical protein ASF69_00350 [Rhizobium sp. Leaf311]
MADEKTEFQATDATQETVPEDKSKRERSSIEFPYVPLEAATEVARAIYARCGFGSCDQDELAAQMGQTLSGAFRMKTGGAKIFGLVEKDGRSAFKLSEIGKRIVSSEFEQAAKVDAFLSVPLYQQLYDKFRGHNLPPTKALEREMEALGVPHKQTDRARQAFERSSSYAGFSDSGKDRLVKPRIEGLQSSPPEKPTSHTQTTTSEVDRVQSVGPISQQDDIDPIIRGLISRLPASGANWSKSKRKLWLQILENSFDLVYEDDEIL